MKANPQTLEFKASAVRKVGGVTYRQLNDWDSKGALPNQRAGDFGWRKFNAKQFFVILLCAELRRQFGVSLEKIAWLQKFMLQDGADHFSSAVNMMKHGLAVFILTDLIDEFHMEPDYAIGDLLDMGYFRYDEPQSYVLLFVNPLVNRILGMLKNPRRLEVSDKAYDALNKVHDAMRVRDSAELAVLELMRRTDGSKFTVTPKGHNEITLEIEVEVGKNADIQKELEKEDFQTVVVKRQDKKTVRIFRKVVKKVAKEQLELVAVRLPQ